MNRAGVIQSPLYLWKEPSGRPFIRADGKFLKRQKNFHPSSTARILPSTPDVFTHTVRVHFHSLTKMRLSPFLLVVAAAGPLLGLAAPIDRSPSYYDDIGGHSIHPSSPLSPNCYRRWRHHGSHLAFRLSRLHTCCREPEQPLDSAIFSPVKAQSFQGPVTISGVVPRRRRP